MLKFLFISLQGKQEQKIGANVNKKLITFLIEYHEQ